MKVKRYWFLGTLVLVLATVMVVLGPVGMSVGQNGYTTIGGLSVSPSGAACIGGTVTFSGGGAPANAPLTVWMHWATFEWPSASLGSTTTDGAGNWSLTTTIPTMQENGSGVPSPLLAGDWVVQAYDASFYADADLTVVDCSGPLPATGSEFPLAGAGLLGAGLLIATGLGGMTLRARRR